MTTNTSPAKTEKQDKKGFLRLLENILVGNKAPLIVLVLSILLSVLSPYFLTTTNVINVIRQVCVATIASVGLVFILGAGEIDLSLGLMMGLLGVILGKLLKTDLPVGVSILVVLVTGVVLGAFNATIITIFKINSFIATLATGSVYQGANYLISNLIAVTDLPDSFVFIGQGDFLYIPIPIYIMLVVVAIGAVFIKYTKYGRQILAVGGNKDAARACGINLTRIRYLVFMVGGLCAAMSAIVMTGRAASAQVSAGASLIMDAIAAVVIGGTSLHGGVVNVWGALFGGLVVMVVNNGLNLLGINANWQIISKGLLILIAVVLDNWVTRYYSNRMKST